MPKTVKFWTSQKLLAAINGVVCTATWQQAAVRSREKGTFGQQQQHAFFLTFFVRFLQTAVPISSLLVNLSLTMLGITSMEPG